MGTNNETEGTVKKSELPPKAELVRWLIVIAWMFLGVYIRDQYVPKEVHEREIAALTARVGLIEDKAAETASTIRSELKDFSNNSEKALRDTSHKNDMSHQAMNARIDQHIAQDTLQYRSFSDTQAKLEILVRQYLVLREIILKEHPGNTITELP